MAIGKPYAVRISRVSQANADRGYYLNFGENFGGGAYRPKYVQVVPQGKEAITLVFYHDKKCKNDGRWLIDQNKKRTKIAYMDNLEDFVGEYTNCAFGTKMHDGGMVFRIFSSDRSVFTHLYSKRSGQTVEVKPAEVKKPEEPSPDIFEKCLTGEVKKEEEVPMQTRTMSYWARKQEQYNNIILDPIKKDIASIEEEIAKLQTRKEKLETTLEVMGKLYSKGAIKLP